MADVPGSDTDAPQFVLLGVGTGVTARLPEPEEQQTFGIGPDEPVLVILRLDRDVEVLPAHRVVALVRSYGVWIR